MKRKSYYKYAAIALVLILVAAVIPSSAEGEDIYFTAVNDTLSKLEASTMPYYDKEQFYVPYKIFDDLSLGVYYTYNKENHTLTLFNRRNTLIFQLLLGYSYDNNQQYHESVINRNNTLYIPIKFVCERFGLELQVIKTPVQVLRVVSDAELSQNEFKDKYYNRIVTEGKEYQNSSQDASPSPSTSYQPGVSPTPSEEPKVIPEIYLMFDCFLSDGLEEGQKDGLKKLLDTLDEHKAAAAFFLTEDFIDSERDTVLRFIGMGHTIGLLIPDSDTNYSEPTDHEVVVDYVNRANRLLDSYTYTKTKLCRFQSDLSSSDHEVLREGLWDAGFAVWGWTMNADSTVEKTALRTASQWASEIEELAGDGQPIVFRVGLTEDIYQSISTLMGYLDNKDAIIRIITPAKDPEKIIR